MTEIATASLAVPRPRQLLNALGVRLPLAPAAFAFWLAVVAPAAPAAAVAGVAAASVFLVANRCLLAPMLRLARGMSLKATRLFAPDDLGLEYVLALMGVPVAAASSASLPLAVLTLAPIVLIQMTQRA